MTITPQTHAPASERGNGHDKASQLRALNREYQPLLSALTQNQNSATHAVKLVQLEYHRKRQAILNGHTQAPLRT